MKIEQFTEKAREAISEANELAKQYNHSQIEAEHLLAALLAQEGGVVQQIVQKVGGNLATAQRMVTSDLERLPRVYGGSEPGISPRLRRLLKMPGRKWASSMMNTSALSICCLPCSTPVMSRCSVP